MILFTVKNTISIIQNPLESFWNLLHTLIECFAWLNNVMIIQCWCNNSLLKIQKILVAIFQLSTTSKSSFIVNNNKLIITEFWNIAINLIQNWIDGFLRVCAAHYRYYVLACKAYYVVYRKSHKHKLNYRYWVRFYRNAAW